MDEVEFYKDLGRTVANRRKRLDRTQAAVAKAAGMSRASLANMEVGRQKILVHQLYRLAAALDLDSPAKLLPALVQPAVSEDAGLTISHGDLNARQRAQIEQVYKSIGVPRTSPSGNS